MVCVCVYSDDVTLSLFFFLYMYESYLERYLKSMSGRERGRERERGKERERGRERERKERRGREGGRGNRYK